MTCGPASFFPLTYVPLVDFRSRTMIFPSLTTILVCFFEMLPLGRQMSFSSTRPMVISSDSKSSRWVEPRFSVRMTLNGIVGSSLIEDGERHGVARVFVQLPRVLDKFLDPFAARRHHLRRHIDGELGLLVDEVPALEELADDR